jgi:hypothetical protein
MVVRCVTCVLYCKHLAGFHFSCCNIYNTAKHSNEEIAPWKNNICNIEIQRSQHLSNGTPSMTYVGLRCEHQSGVWLAFGAQPRGGGGTSLTPGTREGGGPVRLNHRSETFKCGDCNMEK